MYSRLSPIFQCTSVGSVIALPLNHSTIRLFSSAFTFGGFTYSPYDNYAEMFSSSIAMDLLVQTGDVDKIDTNTVPVYRLYFSR